jgi:predicted branched-subunit amino acid permease
MTTATGDRPHVVTARRTASSAGVARDARAEVRDGALAMLPWLIGVVPFGMVVGMTAASATVPTEVGLATGSTIYSGSAQLSAIELLSAGAGVPVVLLSVLAINARLVLYSSSIAPHWRGTSTPFRLLAALLLVDPSYAVGMHRYADGRRGGHVHYLSAGVTLFVAWHLAMVAGAVLGHGVPGWLPVQVVVPLFLVAEIVQAVRSAPALTAAVVAGVVALAGRGLPMHSGLLVAVVAGVASAVIVERRTS